MEPKRPWREAGTNRVIYGIVVDSKLSGTLHPNTQNFLPIGKSMKEKLPVF
jgi:hypothetical protein